MNLDEIIKDMEAFESEGAEWMTPVQYSKVRPIKSPQVYQYLRRGVLSWKHCDCGRRVINVKEADQLLRAKGKLPPEGPEDEERDGSQSDASTSD